MFPRDLTYDSPYWAFLLLAVLAFGALFWLLFKFRQHVLAPFLNYPSLNPLVIPHSQYLFWLKTFLFCLAWIFATIAIMQPKGNGRYPEEVNPSKNEKNNTPQKNGPVNLLRKSHEVIFLLDVSASMDVHDTRIGDSRLSYAKNIIDAVVEELTGETVSLYAFTSLVTTIVPPTLDYFYLRMMLQQININEGDIPGTDFLETLNYMHNEVLDKASRSKLKTLVILSDGEDNQFEELKGEARDNFLKTIVKNVQDASELNLRVFSIGIGTQAGGIVPALKYQGKPIHSSMQEVILKALSAEGRGKYYEADQFTPLLLALDLIQQMKQDNPYVDNVTAARAKYEKEDLVYDLFFQVPLGLAILFLWLAVSLPNVAATKEKEKSSLPAERSA